MYSIDIENKEYSVREKLAVEETDDMDEFDHVTEELDEEAAESYNPSWTLRKCCSKLLDKLSLEFPKIIFDVLRPFLETDMQHKDWIIKERSILVFGAIGVGQYESVKPHLNNLLRYLIGELHHPNKLVRAISCWTISRFYSFLIEDNLSDSKDELFCYFLSELVKSVLDKENIVQTAACSAFNSLIKYNKEKISPYINEILKKISSVLEENQGSSLLALYETIIVLAENYPDQFRNLDLITEVLNFIMKKWYNLIEHVKTPQSNREKFLSTDLSNVVFFDLLGSIAQACGDIIQNYLEDFIEGSLRLIRFLSEDKEIICKSLDLISVLCNLFPEKIRNSPSKFKIIEEVFILIQHDKEITTKQYVLALIGDLCRVDTNLLEGNIDPLIEILTNHIQILDFKNCRGDMNLISVCNNSCWTLGILAVTFKDKIEKYVEIIIGSLLNIIKAPKLNKSLAQNISICIGRLGMVSPKKVANYMPYFIKQFCMSLKTAESSLEKQEAFE
jgi:transportin-1